ncbi:hypothetical protein KIPE111705_30735 [Kibdelosporangium persicum]|uniref:hypothetical protein n=1 Tax=Kibdelosporangium persicum TaxID=2698649 RepID=UPI001563A8DF|nr:hypothetical protein [Kibdelosporangium persicum]
MRFVIQQELRSSRCCDDGYAKADRSDAGQALGLVAFLPEVACRGCLEGIPHTTRNTPLELNPSSAVP